MDLLQLTSLKYQYLAIHKTDIQYANPRQQKPDKLSIEYEMYKGERYRVILIKKDILRAIESGDIVIKPLELQIEAEVPGKKDIEDGFRLSLTHVTATVISNALKIKVKS